MLCYYYGRRTAINLHKKVGNKQWGYVAIRLTPEIAQWLVAWRPPTKPVLPTNLKCTLGIAIVSL